MDDIGFEDLMKKAHVFKMLSIMRVGGEIMQDDIDKVTCNNRKRTPEKLRLLEDCGLVMHRVGTPDDNDHIASFWSLTPRGKALAECLEKGRRIFEGEIPLEEQ